MRYELGDKVEFKAINAFKGIGEIVETETGNSKDYILIKLPDEFKGQGHDGNGCSKKRYETNDYWFIREEQIIKKVEIVYEVKIVIGVKCRSKKLMIIREMTGKELDALLEIINAGTGYKGGQRER